MCVAVVNKLFAVQYCSLETYLVDNRETPFFFKDRINVYCVCLVVTLGINLYPENYVCVDRTSTLRFVPDKSTKNSQEQSTL